MIDKLVNAIAAQEKKTSFN